MKSNNARNQNAQNGTHPPPEEAQKPGCSNELDPRVRHMPWLKSCGPKTPEGKARSRLNATKHGIWSKGFRLCRKENSICYERCVIRDDPDWPNIEPGTPCPVETFLHDELIASWLMDSKIAADAEYRRLVEEFVALGIREDRANMAIAHEGARMFRRVNRVIDGRVFQVEELTAPTAAWHRLSGRKLKVLKLICQRRHYVFFVKDFEKEIHLESFLPE